MNIKYDQTEVSYNEGSKELTLSMLIEPDEGFEPDIQHFCIVLMSGIRDIIEENGVDANQFISEFLDLKKQENAH